MWNNVHEINTCRNTNRLVWAQDKKVSHMPPAIKKLWTLFHPPHSRGPSETCTDDQIKLILSSHFTKQLIFSTSRGHKSHCTIAKLPSVNKKLCGKWCIIFSHIFLKFKKVITYIMCTHLEHRSV